MFQRIVNNTVTLRQIPVLDNKAGAEGPSEDYVNGGQLPFWFAIGSWPTKVDEKPGTIPEEFTLEQNFPNPFTPLDNLSRGHSPLGGILSNGVNPETTIRYTLPSQSHVTVAVYDLSGRLVNQLEDNARSAGEHRVTWNGRDELGNAVASGIYFYRVHCCQTRLWLQIPPPL